MLEASLLGLFFGTIGTTLGGIIGIFTKITSNKFLSFILSFTSGLMLAIICFDLIPSALQLESIYLVIIGMIIGIVLMIVCDKYVNKKLKSKNNSSLLKTGIVVSLGLALHNIPEGLAIGSGFNLSISLGLSLAISICLHDIPEGLSMAIPMKKGGMKSWKIILYVILSGIATGIGSLIGNIVGNISDEVIGICLSLAAGAMLYIVSGELIPESNKLYQGKMTSLGNMVGFIIGLMVMVIK